MKTTFEKTLVKGKSAHMAIDIRVVDSELIKMNIDRDKALQAMMAGPQAAAALGLQFGAEIIIVGKAIVKGSAERIKDTSFRSYQAKVSLRAIRTDTAEILAYDSHSTAKIHVDDLVGGSMAIQEATTLLIAQLIPRALSRWGAPVQGQIQRIQLVIGNVRQVWQVAALKKMFQEQIKGVEDVVQRSFVSSIAFFEVQITGTSQHLAEPQYFRIKVLSVTANKWTQNLCRWDPRTKTKYAQEEFKSTLLNFRRLS